MFVENVATNNQYGTGEESDGKQEVIHIGCGAVRSVQDIQCIDWNGVNLRVFFWQSLLI